MKVLIAEEDRVSQSILSHAIQESGYDWISACHGEDAFEKFMADRPDVVLADIEISGMSGLDLLKKIRKVDESAIVIMITCFEKPEHIIRALQLQANDFFQKPISGPQLVAMLKKYENLLKEREIENRIRGMVIRKTMTVQFDNNTECVPQYVSQLLREAGKAIPAERKLGIHLGLSELILNSMEHGNLDISFEEKSKATSVSHNKLSELIGERRQDPRFRDRRVTVDFTLDSSGCEWMIRDEGPGFDWQSVPNPSGAESLMLSHGRGIFLSRFQFDEMEYLGSGNTVRVKIHAPPEDQDRRNCS